MPTSSKQALRQIAGSMETKPAATTDGTGALKMRPADLGQYSAPAAPAVAAMYDEDYYERGVEKGISGYSNYRWIPELTIPMAMTIIDTMGIRRDERVLDFGCAKGFTVRALRMLHRDAVGIDISEYAISQCPPEVSDHCALVPDLRAFSGVNRFHHAVAKDVLEHVPYETLDGTLGAIAAMSQSFMVVVPLGDGQGRYRIDAYERDITHIIREPAEWWSERLRNVYRDVTWRHHVDGIKDNWHKVDPLGNAVLIARDPRSR